MSALPFNERLHFAHVLYELKDPIHKDVLKHALENGEEVFPPSVARMTANLKFSAVTAEDIDALPWDEESRTVKRCQWCASFACKDGEMISGTEVQTGKRIWFCNGSCVRKQRQWNNNLPLTTTVGVSSSSVQTIQAS